MSTLIQQLRDKRLIWSATEQGQKSKGVRHQGYPELDKRLTDGFPTHGMMEIASALGVGELRLVLPYLKSLMEDGRLMVFIAPPCQVNATMLLAYGIPLSQCLLLTPESDTEALWCAEQCLRSGACSSVILWQQQLQIHQAKRLHHAAEKSHTLHILFHPPATQKLSLPIPFRLSLKAVSEGVKVTVERQKRGWPIPSFIVNMRQQWPSQTAQLPYTNVVSINHAKAHHG